MRAPSDVVLANVPIRRAAVGLTPLSAIVPGVVADLWRRALEPSRRAARAVPSRTTVVSQYGATASQQESP